MSGLSAALTATALLGASLLLVGCSSGPGSDTTCNAYAKLGVDDAESAAKAVLKDKGLDESQSSVARFDIINYCEISGETAAAHGNDPISSTPDIHG